MGILAVGPIDHCNFTDRSVSGSGGRHNDQRQTRAVRTELGHIHCLAAAHTYKNSRIPLPRLCLDPFHLLVAALTCARKCNKLLSRPLEGCPQALLQTLKQKTINQKAGRTVGFYIDGQMIELSRSLNIPQRTAKGSRCSSYHRQIEHAWTACPSSLHQFSEIDWPAQNLTVLYQK